MTFIDGAQARALAAKWRTLAYNGLCRSGTWDGNDVADRMEYMADELEALAAEQQQPAAEAEWMRHPQTVEAKTQWDAVAQALGDGRYSIIEVNLIPPTGQEVSTHNES